MTEKRNKCDITKLHKDWLEISFLYNRILSGCEKDKSAFAKAREKDVTSWTVGREDLGDVSDL